MLICRIKDKATAQVKEKNNNYKREKTNCGETIMMLLQYLAA
jgi:hypothetical protein